MNKLLSTLILMGCLSGSQVQAAPTNQSGCIEVSVSNIDKKNVLAQVNHVVILRSFEESFWGTDVNSRKCFLEAYDIHTGNTLWIHQDYGMIVSFILVNDRLIYRNYNYLTCIDTNTGRVLWQKKTKGEYSTIAGE